MKTLHILFFICLTITLQKKVSIMSDYIEEEDYIELAPGDELNLNLSSRTMREFNYKTYLEDSQLEILESDDNHVVFRIDRVGLIPIKLRRVTVNENDHSVKNSFKTVYVNSSSRWLK